MKYQLQSAFVISMGEHLQSVIEKVTCKAKNFTVNSF